MGNRAQEPAATDWLNASTVLLTGASGRVGQRLSARLHESGAKIRTVVLPEDPMKGNLPDYIDVIEGTLSDPDVVSRSVKGVDAVVHLAALMDWRAGANEALFHANVTSTFLLLEALAGVSTPVHRVVVVSSDEVYPALHVDGEIHENRELNPYSFYGLTKQLDEVMANFYARTTSLPIAIARFSLTAAAEELSRHDGWSGRLFFASGLRALMEGLGRQDAVSAIDAAVSDSQRTLVLARDELGHSYRFQFCDVRDLVEGLVCLLVAPGAVGGTFNLSGPAPFDYEEVVPKLSEATGFPFVEVSIPGPRFDVRTSTERAQRLAGYSPQYGINEILEAMGGTPKDLTR